jgi:magnesium transporter
LGEETSMHDPVPSAPTGLPTRNGSETAAGHVVASVTIASATTTCGALLAAIACQPATIQDVVLVTDEANRYLGVAEIGNLISAPSAATVGDLVRRSWPCVEPHLDQELALEAAAAAGVATLPVVDEAGHPLGCIPAARLLEIAAAEHREDVHRMAGITRETRLRRHALEDAPSRRFARRMPWLLVGLGLSTVGTAIMVGFKQTIEVNIAAAFFIPAIVYLTDAIGTQTEAIAVRGLSVAERPFPVLLLGEIATGGLIGAALGALATAGILLAFGDLRLALGVGLTLIVAGALASVIGLALPWSLSRIGVDPALGSGPVATILQDVLTLLVYFTILTALL